jgi:hypothetical protein
MARSSPTRTGEAFVKDYKLTKEDVQKLRDAEFFEKGAHLKKTKVNEKLDDPNVTLVKVYANDKKKDGVTTSSAPISRSMAMRRRRCPARHDQRYDRLLLLFLQHSRWHRPNR